MAVLMNMEYEVVVTRKEQITIPAELRRKYNIREGTRLEVIDTGYGILLKPARTVADLAGDGSSHAAPEEMKKLLNLLREEDL